MKRMIKSVLIAACCLPALPAQSQEADVVGHARAWNELAGEKVEALGLKGDAARGEEAFRPCQGCHKQRGAGSLSGGYPRLAGQHANVIIKQLTDIRSGQRRNPKMAPFSEEPDLTTQDIADIATYLQALPVPPNIGKGNGDALARGRQLYAQDCATCHGDKGEGSAAKFYPQIAAQHYKYMLRAARLIRDGRRGNANPDMMKVIKAYSDEDLEAVLDYVSRLGG